MHGAKRFKWSDNKRMVGLERDNEGKGFDELRKEREKRAVRLI